MLTFPRWRKPENAVWYQKWSGLIEPFIGGRKDAFLFGIFAGESCGMRGKGGASWTSGEGRGGGGWQRPLAFVWQRFAVVNVIGLMLADGLIGKKKLAKNDEAWNKSNECLNGLGSAVAFATFFPADMATLARCIEITGHWRRNTGSYLRGEHRDSAQLLMKYHRERATLPLRAWRVAKVGQLDSNPLVGKEPTHYAFIEI